MTLYWHDVRYWIGRTAGVVPVVAIFSWVAWTMTHSLLLSVAAGIAQYAAVTALFQLVLLRKDDREARRTWRRLRRLTGRYRDCQTIRADHGRTTLQCRRRGFRGFLRVRADDIEPSLYHRDRAIVPIEMFLLAPTGRVLRWTDAWPALVADDGSLTLDVARMGSSDPEDESFKAGIHMLVAADMLATTPQQLRELIEQVEGATPAA